MPHKRKTAKQKAAQAKFKRNIKKAQRIHKAHPNMSWKTAQKQAFAKGK